MKKILKSRKAKVAVILILVMVLLWSAFNLPDMIKTAFIRQYIFSEIAKLEESENPVFYEMRLEKIISEEWEYKITVFAMLDNNITKDLFSVSANYAAKYRRDKFKVFEDDLNVYLCRDGVSLFLNETISVDDEDEETYIFRDDSVPFIIQYEKSTGEITEKSLNDPAGRIILELFSYENNLNYLTEKRTEKTPFYEKSLLFDTSPWKNSVGFLDGYNQKEFDFKVVGNSALTVYGCLINDDYYFPAVDGIYKINLQSNEVELCLKKDYRKYNRVQIVDWNNSFIVIEEKIVAMFIGWPKAEEKDGYILEYTENFRQIKRNQRINTKFDNTTVGSDGVILYDENAKESVYYSFSDFSNVLLPQHNYGDDVGQIRWHFIDPLNEFRLVRIGEGDNKCEIVLSHKE